MEVIILAGGFGTRLSHIVKDVPKPMAQVAGKPFLQYILDILCEQGVDRIVLATGYKHRKIEEYFGDHYKNIQLCYSQEISPLGTGGAIKKALSYCKQEYIFVCNGDTFFSVNLADIMNTIKKKNAETVIAIKKMQDFDRYGTVKFDSDDRVTAFEEKKYCREGWINGGVYCIRKNALKNINTDSFSFEKDYLEKTICKKNIFCIKQEGYFIDIGIESDYYKAQKEFCFR